MREVTASAPGKVNLLLRCGAPTDDGYQPRCSKPQESTQALAVRLWGLTSSLLLAANW